MGNAVTAEELSELIIAEWHDSMSDSGAIWEKAAKALNDAKQGLDEDTIERAYKLAYGRSNRGQV